MTINEQITKEKQLFARCEKSLALEKLKKRKANTRRKIELGCGFGPIDTGEIEVGYLLHKVFWGKGYASEALMFLLEWAKENIQAEYIIAFAPVEHLASARVMQKCGMKHYKNDNAKGVAGCFYRIKNS